MATLTVQNVTKNGVDITHAAAAAGGDEFANDSSQRTFFSVINASGAPITVTIATQSATVSTAEYGTLAQASIAYSVGAGETSMLGPFNNKLFNNTNSRVAVTYSGVTTLTVAAINLGYP